MFCMPQLRVLMVPVALLGAQASAQQAESESDEPIVVTGQSQEAARERAEAFIDSIGVAGGEVPAARWEDKVCPKVVGLAPHLADRVLERVRAVATDAGIALAGARCRTNIVISFVADGAALMRDISDKSPRLLEEVTLGKRDALRNGAAPIRWWYRSELVGKDKRGGSSDMPVALLGDFGNVPTRGDTTTLSQYDTSVVSSQTMRVLRSANVVVDASKIAGRSLDALAAYAALVAFAEIKGDALPAKGTILGLFETDNALIDLSEQDRNFLAGLYRLRLDRSARQHRGSLVAAMTRPPREREPVTRP